MKKYGEIRIKNFRKEYLYILVQDATTATGQTLKGR